MMRLPRRQFLRLAAGAAAFPPSARIASAQGYPSRPITIVVPTGAGGPSDVIARIVAERMRASLGQPRRHRKRGRRKRNDRHRPGRPREARRLHAGLQRLVLHARGERSDLRAPLRRGQRFRTRCAGHRHPAGDPRQEGHAGERSEGIDRVAQGKSRQGVAGTNRPRQPGACGRHPVPEADRHPLPVRELSQRRPGHAGSDRRAHRPDVRRPNIALEHVRAGSIKAYAVTAKNRLAAAPDIPTVDEAGLPGFYAAPWYAFWAPKGTPRDVIDKAQCRGRGCVGRSGGAQAARRARL